MKRRAMWRGRRKTAVPLVRIPASRGLSTRIEVRNPDPAANPYLALAVMLKAGLDGIKNELPLPEQVDRNIYVMDDEERRAAGIESLPSTLKEALEELQRNPVICEALGEHALTHFVRSEGNRMGHVPHASASLGTGAVYVAVLMFGKRSLPKAAPMERAAFSFPPPSAPSWNLPTAGGRLFAGRFLCFGSRGRRALTLLFRWVYNERVSNWMGESKCWSVLAISLNMSVNR